MSRDIPDRDQNILWGRSGNRCAMPDCHGELVIEKKTEGDRSSVIGEMAHIKGEKPTAPRHGVNMIDKERNCYENLILLCAIHHKEIDDQLNTYTVEKLHEMKEKHEKWVRDSTEQQVKTYLSQSLT